MLIMSNSEAAERRWILNYLALLWLSVAILPGAYIGLKYVNPLVFEEYPKWRLFNEILMCYGVAVLMANWLLIRCTKITSQEIFPMQSGLENEEICEFCKKHKPPRSHHCNLCKVCVLKHDHHCFFAGNCIGHANQRYFVVFTFWLCLGASYCWFVGAAYTMRSDWKNVDWMDFLIVPITIVRWLLGYISTYQVFVIVLLHSAMIAAYGAGFLFLSQMYLICKGFTSYERKKGLVSPVQHLPIRTLIEMTFGRYWLLNFVAPIGMLNGFEPRGDGVTWNFKDTNHRLL